MGNNVKIYASIIEDTAREQIDNLSKVYDTEKIRIMSDVHAGAGCTIGTTIKIKDKITPNLVGVDLGCGMLCVGLGAGDIGPLSEIDKIIKENIPMGMNINYEANDEFFDTKSFKENLLCKVNFDRAFKSLGTLGSGNHFIEIDVDDEGKKYLVIHTGSRHLGVEICKYYQDLAIRKCFNGGAVKQEIINKLKAEGRECDIQEELKNIKKPDFDKSLAYLQGQDMEDYLHDMKLAQQYAKANRVTIASVILRKLNLKSYGQFETIHNYIDLDKMIIRKGAVSAKEGEILIIPMNMRDGSLICRGKGNEDWNYSAPHGAGRLMSRTKAKEDIELIDYKDTMNGIYSTSVNSSTLDEAPQAYKPMDTIINDIKDTVDILKVIKPIYNIKATE